MPVSPSPQTPRNSPRAKQDATPSKPKAAVDKQTTIKAADFGKAIGIDRPANVRDKIKKWQADLEGDDSGAENAVASGPDSDVRPVPSPKLQATPKITPAPASPSPLPVQAPIESVEAAPERPKSAKKPVHNKLDEEVLVATAPKKRVVSDSNWRNRKSPPKDGTARQPPKPLPTAWVRPALRKPDSPANKVSTPPPKQPVLFAAKTAGQRTRNQRQRRASRPVSSGNDERPTSSGSGSAKDAKSGNDEPKSPKSPSVLSEKPELIRVRRRRQAQPSSRSSLSADDLTPVKRMPPRKSETSLSENPEDLITVEYEPTRSGRPRDDDIRERRRRSRRKDYSDKSPEGSPRDPASSGKRRHRRKSNQKDSEDGLASPPPEPVKPETPAKAPANRLEAWLQTTPDPFVDTDSRRRRKPSKESISTLELSHKPEKSEDGTSVATKDVPAEHVTERASGSRRRRRAQSTNIRLETDKLGDEPPSVVSNDSVDVPLAAREGESTPSPTLRRRGATRSHRSPTKDRVMSLPVGKSPTREEDVASSAPSSSVDATALDLEKIVLRPRPDTLAVRRMFPSTGKRLSTIVSVETFATKTQAAPPSDIMGSETAETVTQEDNVIAEVPASEVSQSHVETSTIVSRKSTRRSRLASHADLISVLSMPKAGAKSIVSARSIRTNRSRLATATIPDIMRELASDETKYMRELRTLVDGVIPVLLSCVLSKSDSAVAAGLFSRSANTDPNNVTKPIVDMGVSLERLKTLHKRIPKDNSDALISWAQSAQRIYADYISAWRLGFQDVVISLAAADEDPFTPAKVVDGPDDGAPWDEGLPRNAEGYVINGDGERVDVAYMLKRPLVRLKYLAKSMKGINHIKPSEQAEKVSNLFQNLVGAARKRSNDEHARLEDEAAANIDPTRARDPRSLAPLAGVRVDANRCVRARDHFEMHLYHSTGQELNCRVELLYRDDAPGVGKSGDILMCEVDGTGRWLLLPPIQHSRISARNGDLRGEIIVQIRGYNADGSEWSEVLSLRTDDEQAGFDWVQMLGLNPIPPLLSELNRNQDLVQKTPRPTSSHASSSLVSGVTQSTQPLKSRTPSPHEIAIPIGEQANSASKKWGYDTPDRRSKSRTVSPTTPPSDDASDIRTAVGTSPVSPSSPVEPRLRVDDGPRTPSSRPTSRDDNDRLERTPRSLNEAMQLARTGSPLSLKRSKAKRLSRPLSSPTSPQPSRQIILDDPAEDEIKQPRKLSKRHQHKQHHSTTSSLLSQSSKGFSVWMPTSEAEDSDGSDEDERLIEEVHEPSPPTRPTTHRRASSVPSMDLPVIPKMRKSSQPTTSLKDSFDERQEMPDPPASAPPKLRRRSRRSVEENIEQRDEVDQPPPVPPHRSPSPATPVTLKGSKTPIFTPSVPGHKTKRRSSSPLKHEYEPSTCSETSSESEQEISEDEVSLTSESSEDELEDDVPTPLMPLGQTRPFPKVSPPASIYTLPNGTITPSQSASQTPYRAVPQSSGQATKAVASIFSWADAGRWDSLHPEECSIIVTPGKIEIFELSSKPLLVDGGEVIRPDGRVPLIVLELTPLVPMRKSTAIDITIRSPPIAESRIKSGNNVMLRSRSPADCARLYGLINQSRINNPTYIALQNARGPYGQTSWAETMERQNAARSNPGTSNGWFGGSLGRRSSYRKTSTRAASISAATESSVGTMNTALRSALGRFSFNRNGRFNIKDSTLGSRSLTSFDTGSSGSGSGTSTPNCEPPGRALGAPVGITNTKCRLYERDSLTKWKDMGAARLTIMLPDLTTSQTGMRQGKGSPGMRDPSQEKRIVVEGKKEEILLDVTLTESCFERVARTGIAVSVWEDFMGPDGIVGRVAHTGGVSGARARTFMIQMKSERECAYSYSLLGKLRY
ncbi:hypothetical protein BDV95DRAFT_604219 [Massariosphaeria phaeospora]|uniref:SRm160/300 splicing coactivator n=1 Tax=Massariosphaeria phaeospora TaxID=100035 RepID=A0A7C8MP99_9PLEO|nr:hypothetical protein BDV95DRAFT_604219 [Massariosphaeria phaeospora]